ncbi:hypothetical protein [Streptomyces botrytidirepellens]|uniref:Uncharacterized protein n=1 Tax=Streptomyces botrytidirepellens TaxID=2486417 RepID=A0A3M8V616_9ACTN|nr:hypothetical protein [Streptomyces botrytidirepellens]RNG12427.1 hypothetical protein EEJ42_32225 [Streptomyces botrytidirepellens]
MTDTEGPPKGAAEWTGEQQREALRILLRHTHGAPGTGSGNTGERSAAIRRRVHRVQHTNRLNLELGAAVYLSGHADLSRADRSRLYEVSRALRAELHARQQQQEDT